MTYQSDDTICALATAAGGAMATIRISGVQAVNITDALFASPTGHRLADCRSHTLHYGSIIDDKDQVIDDVVVTLFRAPRSYTGEDTAEISCHGSRYIISLILQQLIRHGCRQAGPGEFTQRAFLNGKMDLSQAEAVADLIASSNATTHKMALSQLRGNFSHQLIELRDQLLHLTTLLELELDFSDHEDLEFADRTELLQLTQRIDAHIQKLADSFQKGNAIKQGIPVAIIGKTNVGKSTLLNRLLHDDKAIVSDIHGTTRDVIEDTINIGGVTFRFIDTAGIRNTNDAIEQLGIERTYQKLDEAAIVLWLTDTLPTEEEAENILKRTEGKKLIAVVNKIDLHAGTTFQPFSPISSSRSDAVEDIPVVEISAKHNLHLDALEDAIYKAADIPSITQNDVVVTSLRHFEALTKAHDDILRVEEGLQVGISGDLLSEDLRACIDHLAEIVGGTITPGETLENIFSHFCVGK
ncbi:MAG: tRNA uridine-5-carboxymethylaminomethyl(34) synthesis GTPase MnmE [Prevotella sp.]|nr:tRNA uridine-5-carboxymethylaminomethyl(34) synthesis GTPase MnmE [Prevotella sp.]